ncbi:ArsR/SmtB family transcription factor [Actinophytocola oryzae]|uniref:Helix-turn-helix protein n=1 Tax=Actinophytocola oryzae TaxID=502181 RepID=A0A4R7VI29_9PSEU|nr:metalloregulator ArsR/SmtB family transcription factor [Actinophytocola oryzae]TDV48827.1 helix-turn-helix protein [Actinophytocola oryzae]
MLRIVFTPEDLGRTRLCVGSQPMWETVLSLYRLRRRDGGVFFESWWRSAATGVPDDTRLLTDLVPPRGYYADFLTPPGSSLAEGVDTLMSTSTPRLRTDLATLAAERSLPAWTRRLADGRTDELRRLGAAVDRYFAACVAPSWSTVCLAVDRERARQTELLATRGVVPLLRELHPSARWEYPVLELDYSVDRELRLDGRGLLLVPSFFCWDTPTTFRDDTLEPTLVYPIRHDVRRQVPGASDRPLSALVGPTRTRMLEAIRESPCSTKDLATRTGVTPPTASRQTSVLRSAGLVTSRRTGQSVLHSLTPQGLALLT